MPDNDEDVRRRVKELHLGEKVESIEGGRSSRQWTKAVERSRTVTFREGAGGWMDGLEERSRADSTRKMEPQVWKA